MTRLRDRNINTDVHHFQISKKNTNYPASDTGAPMQGWFRSLDDVASGITPGYPRMLITVVLDFFLLPTAHKKLDHLEFPQDILL